MINLARSAWPKCGRPAVYCDVHHLRHKQDGGETTVENCAIVVRPSRDNPDDVARTMIRLVLGVEGDVDAPAAIDNWSWPTGTTT
jgi:hypothetical protein